MPRGREREPGLKKIESEFGFPEGPAPRDADPSRGPLKFVPRSGVAHVHDYGGVIDPGELGTTAASPARADFTPGRVYRGASKQTTRTLPETPVPGSLQVTPGTKMPRVKERA